MEIANQSLNNEFSSVSAMDDDAYVGPSARCVLFNLENEVYGIHVKKIREVLRVSHIRRVEGSPGYVLGVINVRGVIVTVFDTRSVFNMARAETTDYSRIIIVEVEEDRTVGMLVDCVLEVRDIPENKIEALSSTKDNPSRYIQGIAHYEGNVIILVDVDNVINT